MKNEEEQFKKAALRVSSWTGPVVKPQDKLTLYGLYKQATVGDCRSQRPGLFDPTGRAKWTSWKTCEGLNTLEAMQQYCRVAQNACPSPPDAALTTAQAEDTQGVQQGRLGADAHDLGTEDADSFSLKERHCDVAKASSHGGQDDPCTFPCSNGDGCVGSGSLASLQGDGGLGRGDCYAQGESKMRRKSTTVALAAGVLGITILWALVGGDGDGAGDGGDDIPVPNAIKGNGIVPWVVRWWLLGIMGLVVTTFLWGSLWVAVRVARWHEEVFAGSPMVAEVMAREKDADRSLHQALSVDQATDCPADRMGGRVKVKGARIQEDPVGDLFRSNPNDSRVVSSESSGVEDEAIVFLTGVTGLVGRMVLYDLLRHGAGVLDAGDHKGMTSQERQVEGSVCNGQSGREGCKVDRGGGGGPRLKRVFVLVRRGKRGVEPADRLEALRNTPMFRPLRRSGAWVDAPEYDGDGSSSCSELDSGVLPEDNLESGGLRNRAGGGVCSEEAGPHGMKDVPRLPLVGEGGGPFNRKSRRKSMGTIVSVVEGDLAKEGLGLSEHNRSLLAGAGITHVLHCAACVRFNNPLPEAASTNVTGALRVAALTASWPSCRTLVHVSTAFVHGSKTGSPSAPLPEELPDLGGRDPERLYNSLRNSSSVRTASGCSRAGKEAAAAMADLGYPNSYTFTKALGEHLLVRALREHNRRLKTQQLLVSTSSGIEIGDEEEAIREGWLEKEGCHGDEEAAETVDMPHEASQLKLRLVRPSIVGPSWIFPWPGWTGEQPSTVTGCLVLLLERVVKTFRLGSHPAPVIPVDIVSRAIVHTALGWGGTSGQSSGASVAGALRESCEQEGVHGRRASSASCGRRVHRVSPLDMGKDDDDDLLPSSPLTVREHLSPTLNNGNSDQGLRDGSRISEVKLGSSPEVLIRNVAWATHPAPAMLDDPQKASYGSASPTNARAPAAFGIANPLEASDGSPMETEGRMPSFRELLGCFWDYIELRGLRTSTESLAMRMVMMLGSIDTDVNGDGEGDSDGDDACLERPERRSWSFPWRAYRTGGEPSFVFGALHSILDRPPVWVFETLAFWRNSLSCHGRWRRFSSSMNIPAMKASATADNEGSADARQVSNGVNAATSDGTEATRDYLVGSKPRRSSDIAAVAQKLDQLTQLPKVYEPFTAKPYFFDSTLRVPASLTPLGYALETVLASELLWRGLPNGLEAGANASPERRAAVLRESVLQIQCHSMGVLRCRGNLSYRRRRAPVHEGGDCDGDGDGDGDGLCRSAPLAFLSKRAERLKPWPALAWWAATLPGSEARGGVTALVRLVAFCVRTVLCHVSAAIAVDVDSFLAAAPPGYVDAAGEVELGHRVEGVSRQPIGPCAKGEEIKEDVVLDAVGHAVGIKLNDTDSEGVKVDSAIGERTFGANRIGVGRGGQDDLDGVGRRNSRGAVVVLLPTHRSYLDFVLISMLCATMRFAPGLSWLRVPRVAAAEGAFGTKGSLMRRLLEKLGAFFVRRGRGRADSSLRHRLKALRLRYEQVPQEPSHENYGDAPDLDESVGKIPSSRASGSTYASWIRRVSDVSPRRIDFGNPSNRTGRARGIGDWPSPTAADPRQRGLETFEVFVEGTRSRDRRFLAPRTGLLRALQAAREGATLWLVPISISYERVPEQAALAEELSRSRDMKTAGSSGLMGLMRWALRALRGEIRLGRIFVRAGKPVALAPEGDVREAVLEIRRQHRMNTVVMPHHLRAASVHLGIPEDDLRECVRALGGTIWEEVGGFQDEETNPFRDTGPGGQGGLNHPTSGALSAAGFVCDIGSRPGGPGDSMVGAAVPPSAGAEAWMCHLQWLHLLEKEIRQSRLSRWADWLVPPLPSSSSPASSSVSSAARGCLSTSTASSPSASASASASASSSSSSSSPSPSPSSSSSPNRVESTVSTRKENQDLGPAGGAVGRVLQAILREFEDAEAAVFNAREALVKQGFSRPSTGHVLQVLREANAGGRQDFGADGVPQEAQGVGRGGAQLPSLDEPHQVSPSCLFLASAALAVLESHGGDEPGGMTGAPRCAGGRCRDTTLSMTVPQADGNDGAPGGVHGPSLARTNRSDSIYAMASNYPLGENVDGWFGASDANKEAFGSWGFRDSGFSLVSDESSPGGEPYVIMTGGRYGICGQRLRGLLPFVREAVGVPLPTGVHSGISVRASTPAPPTLPPSRLLESLDGSHAMFQADTQGRGISAGATGTDGGVKGSRHGFSGGGTHASDVSDDAINGGDGTCREGGGGCRTRTFLKSMKEALGPGFNVNEQVSVARQERARHGTGHGLSHIWALRSERLSRAPDAVVWPTSEDQVLSLMEWAGKQGVCLIPFGGGTSVTRALEVPPIEVEPRPVVSVDMRKMNRVISVDKSNGTAHIEAGAVGASISAELASRGVTMGHEPDSLEFSTLGGWVATRASGMKRGRYGNIEDMVLEVRVATGRGLAWQHSNRSPEYSREGTPSKVMVDGGVHPVENRTDSSGPIFGVMMVLQLLQTCARARIGGLVVVVCVKQALATEGTAGAFSRTSVGLDLASAVLGSEGCLGIITSVLVKILPLPEVTEHASLFFKDFATGVRFCRQLALSSGRLGLASCRLLDNKQLRLGRALRGEEEEGSETEAGLRATWKRFQPAAQLMYIEVVKGWEPKEMSAVTLLFEGTRMEAALQKAEVLKIARAHGGMSGGASAGKSGYDLTFAIAYLRDFALVFNVLGESFETFVSWSALEQLCDRVRSRIVREHRARRLRGDPFLTHRVTQLYPEGACVYFYLAFYAEGLEDPPRVFAELEEAARDEILLAGGSLSHHHGIGKSRAGFMSRVSSSLVSDLVRGMKQTLDPENVLGARNNYLAEI